MGRGQVAMMSVRLRTRLRALIESVSSAWTGIIRLLMDINKEIEFFDQAVAEHGDSEVLSERAYTRVTGLFKQWIAPKPGEVCLDLACGTGAFTRRLRQFDLRTTGVDISPASIDRACSLAAGESYVVGNIAKTDFTDRSADIVVYSGVLHHCTTSSDRQAVLGEGLRLLRPGGRLFAYDPSAHSPSMILYRDKRSPFYSQAGKTDNEVLLNRRELETELRGCGFTNISIRGVSGMTFGYMEGRIARAVLPLYNLYEEAMRYTPLEDRFGTFLVTVARRPS